MDEVEVGHSGLALLSSCELSAFILSKSESPWSPDSADNFKFSAERSSQNAKRINITLFATLFPLFMFSHWNKLSIITSKQTIFSTEMPH